MKNKLYGRTLNVLYNGSLAVRSYHLSSKEESLETRYSNYLHHLRVTSYALRFMYKTSTAFQRRFKMHQSLWKIAELLWVKVQQQNHFTDIFEAIRHRKKHELISKLNLFSDAEGCLRSTDQFKYAPLPYEEGNPVLLLNSTDSHFSCLIIHHFHEMQFHAGTNQTLSTLRKKFWILKERTSVSQVVRACPKYQCFTVQPYKQP